MTAVDTTVSLSTAQLAALRAAGVTAVSRYIAPQSWKRITPAEYGRILAGGLQITLNWESGAQDLRAPGSSTTSSSARDAVAQARACGYPTGAAIYVSADWDVQAGDWSTVAGNLRIIRAQYAAAGYKLGLYAPWDALGWAQRDRLVDYFWQAGMSTSWSGGRNRNAWPGAHLRQRRQTTIAGVNCDLNDILISPFGAAGAGSTSSTGGTVSTAATEDIFNRVTTGRRFADTVGALNAHMPGTDAALAGLTEQVAKLQATQDEVLTAVNAGGTPTAPPVDVHALAAEIAAALIASGTNGLTAADHAGIVVDIKTVLGPVFAGASSALS